MTEQIRVSVSQIRKYKRCARSWWYEYGPLQDKSPSKPSAKLGTMVHDILEKYQTDGIQPPDTKAGRIAACGLHNLPDPAGLEIEKSITLPLSENSKILCRIDMLGTDRAYVGDHKTTSDFKWAKTRAELDTDVQLLTYAYAAYHEEKPPTVDAELLYYRTRGLPVSMVVGCKLPWATIEKNWETIGQIAEEMAPKKADPDGGSCAGNPAACGDYGGCYHAPKCPFSPQNRAATNKPLDNIASHDNNISAEATAPKKETKKMDNKTKKIQDIFGILPPDVAPEEDQTATLEAETSKKLAEMVDLFGGAVPAQTVKDFLIRQGVAETSWPDVLKAAGVEISGQTVAAIAPTPAPTAPEFQAQRSKGCTVDTLKALAAELAKKVEAADGGIAEDAIRAWFAGEIAPKKITTLRWNRLVEFSGLTLDGCWFTSPDANGYTADPEPLTGAEADRAEYKKKTGKKAPVFDHKTNGHPPDYTPQIAAYKIQAGKKAPATEEEIRIKNLTKGAPAIGSRLVVMVDAHFSRTPAHAFHLSVFLAPYIAALEAREQKPFYILDLDHGKGPKLLTGVIAAAWHQDPPVGLITMSALDPLASRVLPLFEKAGALIVYGRR